MMRDRTRSTSSHVRELWLAVCWSNHQLSWRIECHQPLPTGTAWFVCPDITPPMNGARSVVEKADEDFILDESEMTDGEEQEQSIPTAELMHIIHQLRVENVALAKGIVMLQLNYG